MSNVFGVHCTLLHHSNGHCNVLREPRLGVVVGVTEEEQFGGWFYSIQNLLEEGLLGAGKSYIPG
jgi:hypothetical protein